MHLHKRHSRTGGGPQGPGPENLRRALRQAMARRRLEELREARQLREHLSDVFAEETE